MIKSKILLGVAACGMLATTSFSSQADMLFGVHGEVQYWQAENDGGFGISPTHEEWDWKDESATRLSLSFNHFIPLIPNVMFERQLLKSSGSLAHTQDY